MLLKVIAFIATAIPIFLFVRSFFFRRTTRINEGLKEFKKQTDLAILIFLFLIGCVVAVAAAPRFSRIPHPVACLSTARRSMLVVSRVDLPNIATKTIEGNATENEAGDESGRDPFQRRTFLVLCHEPAPITRLAFLSAIGPGAPIGGDLPPIFLVSLVGSAFR
jgi:hypothetical protein